MNVSRVRVERIRISACFVVIAMKVIDDCDGGGLGADICEIGNW